MAYTPEKKMDHIAYPKAMKKKSIAQLRYIIKDCREAIAAMPMGVNANYYADEIHYAAAELRRRESDLKDLKAI